MGLVHEVRVPEPDSEPGVAAGVRRSSKGWGKAPSIRPRPAGARAAAVVAVGEGAEVRDAE